MIKHELALTREQYAALVGVKPGDKSMLSLVISMCMLSDPNTCKDVTFTQVDESVTTRACNGKMGQIELARLMEYYPNWVVKSYKCVTKPLVDERKA